MPTQLPNKVRRKHLLDITLRGLPELDHFRTPADRQNALEELGAEAGNPGSGHFWLAIALIAVGAFAARWVAGWLLNLVLWPRLMEELLHTLGTLTGIFIVLRWLHRSGAAGDLRKKLLESGVPVCSVCGYLLRGLTRDIGRCPECGAAFSSRVCELLEPGHEAGGPEAPVS